MAWSDDKVAAIRARSVIARSATDTWTDEALLAVWDDALGQVQRSLLVVYGATVVASWAVEATCPDGVENLIALVGADLVDERSPQHEWNELKPGEKRPGERTLERIQNGQESLLDADGEAYSRISTGKVVTCDDEDKEDRLEEAGAPPWW